MQGRDDEYNILKVNEKGKAYLGDIEADGRIICMLQDVRERELDSTVSGEDHITPSEVLQIITSTLYETVVA